MSTCYWRIRIPVEVEESQPNQMKADANVNISPGLVMPLRPDCLFPSCRLEPGMDTGVSGATHLHSLHILWPGVARKPWVLSLWEGFGDRYSQIPQLESWVEGLGSSALKTRSLERNVRSAFWGAEIKQWESR